MLLAAQAFALSFAFWGHSPADLFRMGGAVMWPLLACSVVALAIIVERGLVLGRMGRTPEGEVEGAAAAIGRGDLGAARGRLAALRHPVARVLERQLDLAAADGALRAEVVQRAGGLALERVEARLSLLHLVAQVAPLLGLLGTVSGLVGSFWQLEQIQGPVQPSDLASGIWAALLTTVFGLVVGIPAGVAYHLFQDRADSFARHMGFAVTRLEEALAARSGAAGSRAAPREASAPAAVLP